MLVHSRLLFIALAGSLVCLACGGTPGDGDAGPADAGTPDGGALDAGSLDAGPRDGGPGPQDGGAGDGGASDGGSADGGSADGGPSDAAPSDDAGAVDGGSCSYLDLELWIGDCAGGYSYIRRWTDTDGVCPEYFTVGSTRYETLEEALSTSACEAECLRHPSTSVSLIRCGVRTGYIVYRDEGEDCPSLLETPDGLFESADAWDEAFPCPG